ncbi:hypothetical protein GCM10012290_20260 [Halolactibacillus alkaliphilus]|uniref:Hemolysin n=1 Tax=Halolactibacillus alkaliphilus TaxID=442899 RepID=A0A511X3L7_9BACI|nr:hemolysin family protein [Halolactibacillus alkaliphilus]GEN57540.1 hypothetical protein HAL01_20040 [Halolactibacillus alkaliphilus]GGN73416.1 hypothetical protein GCM10012290_20260 [Halolactibacillus alkaliphilus]SFO95929.1 putative hemolysin [Halolactibacillus alkaliphilus]
MGIAVVALVVLIMINAFFAASEIALVSLNDNKVKRMAERGDKKAQALDRLLSQPGRFLATIQIGITLAGFLASAFAADVFSGPLSETLRAAGIPFSVSLLRRLSLVIVTIVLSYITLVFGELVPKQVALKRKEKVANFAVKPITFMFKMSLPIVKLLNTSTNAVSRLFGVDPNSEDESVTEEEIRMLVDIGDEKGTIESSEKRLIHNIFEFNDKDVSDIMTHRTEIEAIEVGASYEEVIALIKEHRFTRFPVYKEDLDEIIGILHTKDLIVMISEDASNFRLADIMRKPYFVMEHQSIDTLLADMQKENIHMAIILDEYGGTDGLVTLEDLIEEIIGEISSEHGEVLSNREVIKHSPYEATVKGTIHLMDLNQLFGIELPVDTYETLNGFLTDIIGYIPDAAYKTPIYYKNIQFDILSVSKNRIEEVYVKVDKNP